MIHKTYKNFCKDCIHINSLLCPLNRLLDMSVSKNKGMIDGVEFGCNQFTKKEIKMSVAFEYKKQIEKR